MSRWQGRRQGLQTRSLGTRLGIRPGKEPLKEAEFLRSRLPVSRGKMSPTHPHSMTTK